MEKDDKIIIEWIVQELDIQEAISLFSQKERQCILNKKTRTFFFY